MIPNIAGWPVKTYGRLRSEMTSERPAWTSRPTWWMRGNASVSRRILSVATAAAAATRLPAYVPPWETLSGSTDITSSLPAKQAAG